MRVSGPRSRRIRKFTGICLYIYMTCIYICHSFEVTAHFQKNGSEFGYVTRSCRYCPGESAELSNSTRIRGNFPRLRDMNCCASAMFPSSSFNGRADGNGGKGAGRGSRSGNNRWWMSLAEVSDRVMPFQEPGNDRSRRDGGKIVSGN